MQMRTYDTLGGRDGSCFAARRSFDVPSEPEYQQTYCEWAEHSERCEECGKCIECEGDIHREPEADINPCLCERCDDCNDLITYDDSGDTPHYCEECEECPTLCKCGGDWREDAAMHEAAMSDGERNSGAIA